MGAWGLGPFENDDAADFAGDLGDLSEGSAVAAVMGDALLAVTLADGYVELPDMSRGLAAASLVAVLAGAPIGEGWPVTREWLDATGLQVNDSLRSAASAVFGRAFEPSDNEWYELWDESGQLPDVEQALAPFRTALT